MTYIKKGLNIITKGYNYIKKIASDIIQSIYVGGQFSQVYYDENACNRILNINSDGSIDNTFSIGTGFTSTVNTIVIQSDGKILVGGYFTSYNNTSLNRIIRLNSDGSIDNTFLINFDNTIYNITI
jgi:hypothetical protein